MRGFLRILEIVAEINMRGHTCGESVITLNTHDDKRLGGNTSYTSTHTYDTVYENIVVRDVDTATVNHSAYGAQLELQCDYSHLSNMHDHSNPIYIYLVNTTNFKDVELRKPSEAEHGSCSVAIVSDQSDKIHLSQNISDLTGNEHIRISDFFSAVLYTQSRYQHRYNSQVAFRGSHDRWVHHFDINEYTEKTIDVLTTKNLLLSAIFPLDLVDHGLSELFHTAVLSLGSENVFICECETPLFLLHDQTKAANTCCTPLLSHPLNSEFAELSKNNKSEETHTIPQDPFASYFFAVSYVDVFSSSSYPPVLYTLALEHHTILIVRNRDPFFWTPIGLKADDAIWRVSQFRLPEAIQFLRRMLYAEGKKMEDVILFRYLNMRTMQDLFTYQYRTPAVERLKVVACEICRHKNIAWEQSSLSSKPHLFVAVLSSRGNFLLRQTARQTWLRSAVWHKEKVFEVSYRFFIGKECLNTEMNLESQFNGEIDMTSISSSCDTSSRIREHLSSLGITLSDLIESEMVTYGDVVELNTPESYRLLTLKSRLMYSWVDENISNSTMFIMRVDDDVYVRPIPIFQQLINTLPVRYWMGSFAYLSSVGRNQTEWKTYNSLEQFGEAETFPLYARGVLFVLSSDLLSILVQKHKEENAYHSDKIAAHPDDTAIGIDIFEIVAEGKSHVVVDDRHENRIALNPSCNHQFSQLQSTTWAVHHVNPSQMKCMWDVDVGTKYYVVQSKGEDLYSNPELIKSYSTYFRATVGNNYPKEGAADKPNSNETNQIQIMVDNPLNEEMRITDEINDLLIDDVGIALLSKQIHVMMASPSTIDEGYREWVRSERVRGSSQRNNLPDLCPCAILSKDEKEKENPDFEISYDRFIP